MVTLTGVGGVGRHDLAVEAAHRLSDEFPTVRLLELATVSDPDAVPNAIACPGCHQQPGSSVSESIAEAMEERRNCWSSTTASIFEMRWPDWSTRSGTGADGPGPGHESEVWGSAMNSCGPFRRWMSMPESNPAAVDLLSTVPELRRRRFRAEWCGRRSAAVRSVGGLTGSHWRSNWRHRGLHDVRCRDTRSPLGSAFRLLVGSRRDERHQTLRPRWYGPSICSTRPRRICFSGVRCSPGIRPCGRRCGGGIRDGRRV